MASGKCGGHWGDAKILQMIMAPPLFVIKINKYCGAGEGGGVREAALKFYTRLRRPLLFVIKINKYCGQKYNANKQYNCILPVTN